MTLHDVQAYVGCRLGGESYQRSVDALITWGWRSTMQGRSGWWCAVTLGDVVLEVAWTIGGANQRNEELRGMVARHQQPAQVSA